LAASPGGTTEAGKAALPPRKDAGVFVTLP
jgi:hypothetical protein